MDEGNSDILLLLVVVIIALPLAMAIPIFRVFEGQHHYDAHRHSDLIMYKKQPWYSHVKEPTSQHSDRPQGQQEYLSSLTAIVHNLGSWSWRYIHTEGKNMLAKPVSRCVISVMMMTKLGSRCLQKTSWIMNIRQMAEAWAWPTIPFQGQGDWQNPSGHDNNGYSVI